MNEYRKMILDGLKERYPEKKFEIHRVVRNNNCSFEGLCVRQTDGGPCGPYVAISHFEERLASGSDLETILDNISVRLHERIHIDTAALRDFEQMKGKIYFRVINYDANRKLLENVPYREYLDLAVVYQAVFTFSKEMYGSLVISDKIMKLWGTTEDELYELAYINSFLPEGVRIRPMEKVVEELKARCPFQDELGELFGTYERPMMYVADTTTYSYGSAAILRKELFKELADKIDRDLLIIPSSTQEYILVPKERGFLAERLKDMLWDVNYNVVDREEILSNHIYQYERETDKIIDLYEGEKVDLERIFSERKFFLERIQEWENENINMQ